MKDKQQIIIVGGGLSGLTLAYLLSKRNINAIVLEASSRLGGRIQTIYGALQTPLELGATWFSDMHLNLLSLTNDLGLLKYSQFSKGISLFQTKSFEPPQKFFVPEAENPSYRLAGGTQMLIDKLAASLDPQHIYKNTPVTKIEESADRIMLHTSNGKVFEGDKAIICIAPQLVSTAINFEPDLPKQLNALLPNIQTWMAGAIKFTLEFNEPFWRNQGYSGMLYSHAGIIVEMYDHTNFEENKYGFTGFLNGSAGSYAEKVRKELVLKQLAELLGEQALKPTSYFDKIWLDEYVMSNNQVVHRPHQNNGHPLLQNGYMDNKLFFGATETANEFPGYMEGAIVAAKTIINKLC